MNNGPHLYGMPETEDKQGDATREINEGDNRASEPGYEHSICKKDGNAVVVKEMSGVTFVESTTDFGRDGTSATMGKRDSPSYRVSEEVRRVRIWQNVYIGGLIGIAFGFIFSLQRRDRRRSSSRA